MLEVIHRYALQRLTMSGEEAMLREYHLNYFLKLVEAVEPKMHGQDLSSWLIRLEAEHENLRAALNWALAAEAGDPVRIEKGVRLAGALAWFWHYRGYWSEGTVWVDKALDWANRLILPSSVKAKALYAAGWMNIGQGNLVRAKACLEESLVLYREINDKWGITHSLDALGELARQRGDYATARPLYETGLELCHELEDQFCAHYQLIGLGFISSEQQDYQGAAKLFGEGLSSCRELGDRYGAARALNGMGELQRRQGNLEQAVAYYEQSLALYQELAHTGNVIAVLYNLGQVELERMDYEKAATHFKYSLVLAYEIKSKRLVGWCLAGLAGVALGQEAFEYSANLFGAAEIVLETIGAHLDPVNQPAYERAVAKLRRQLDEASLKMAWAEGRAMLLEQVISNVLDQQVLALTHA
jgi:non-specific serine/threonine protein kinase